jgi:predicted kinase
VFLQKKIIVVSGLPGAGKSTVAEQLSRTLSLPLLSVDPIEAAMWRSGIPKDATGIAAYEVARAVADEHLQLGHSVIIDAVSPVEAAREMWRTLAHNYNIRLVVIECICSDASLHKQRIANRKRNIPGMAEMTWERVEQRRKEYEPWQEEHLILDSARNAEDILTEALEYVQKVDRGEENRPKTAGRSPDSRLRMRTGDEKEK